MIKLSKERGVKWGLAYVLVLFFVMTGVIASLFVHQNDINIQGIILGDFKMAAVTECNDGIDNDGDGLVDWQFDLGCSGSNDTTERALSRVEEDGWTTFNKSANTQIVYVSNSDGNDSYTGFAPVYNGVDGPKKTLAGGKSVLRNNSADWLLLKRGDVFEEKFDIFRKLDGLSNEERIVISTYGDSLARPLLRVPGECSVSLLTGVHNFVISGWHDSATLLPLLEMYSVKTC